MQWKELRYKSIIYSRVVVTQVFPTVLKKLVMLFDFLLLGAVFADVEAFRFFPFVRGVGAVLLALAVGSLLTAKKLLMVLRSEVAH